MKLVLLNRNLPFAVRVTDVDDIEAVGMIDAGVAVEAPMEATEMPETRQQPPAPESAMLDRGAPNTVKPSPRPRQVPPREKRRRKH